MLGLVYGVALGDDRAKTKYTEKRETGYGYGEKNEKKQLRATTRTLS